MTVDTFTTPGTFTGVQGWLCPANVFFVTVRLWGGGGGSGGGQNLTGAGAGGGGGAFSEILLAVTPGVRYDFQVGARGSAGAANGGNAGGGGDSWFGSAVTSLAKGGTGGLGKSGAAGTGGPRALGIGTVKFSGGTGSAFLSGAGGAGGGSAGSGGQGGDASSNTGGTAGPGAQPGAAGSNHSPPSIIGASPGAGASSGTANNVSAGAQGGAGKVELSYTAYTAGLTDGPIIEIQDAPDLYVATGPSTVYQLDNAYEKSTASSPVIEKIWSRLVPTTLTITEPGLYILPVPAGTTYMDFIADGARGGQGGAISGTTMGGLGGAGGTLRGRLVALETGDLLYIYVGAKGAPGFAAGDGSFGRGGEPGGAGSSQNVFTYETQALGGTAGGWTGAFLNDELDPIFLAGAGAGGGAHGASGAPYTGGAGGVGGGDEAGSGEAGGATNPSFYENIGFGGEGGSLTSGGDGGFNSRFANGGAGKQGDPGVYLAGGATFRLGSYGTGSGPNAQGGGGAGGYNGGGAGGNGAVAGSVAQGGAGGGGGGCSFADARIANVVSARGSNVLDDGKLVLSFLAPFDWVAPF